MTWAVQEKGYSQRRACGLVGLHPKTCRYVAKRSGDEGFANDCESWRRNDGGSAIAGLV